MANLNKVLLMGNLTRDPEMRYTQSGTAIVKLGLAVNRRYRNRQTNEMVEETTFVDVEGWGNQAETINQYMRKGRPIFIEGRLKLDSWESQGQKRSKLVVVLENFQFLGSANGGGGGGGGGGRYNNRGQQSSGGQGGQQGQGGGSQGGGSQGGGGGSQVQAGQVAESGPRGAPQGEDLNFDDIPF
jgi:single-strand DNA-binding protein